VVKRDGHRVPLSNLVSEPESGRSQPAQTKTSRRSSLSGGLPNARRVSSLRSTLRACLDRRVRHSASLGVSG
jgi:hypothetical protein